MVLFLFSRLLLQHHRIGGGVQSCHGVMTGSLTTELRENTTVDVFPQLKYTFPHLLLLFSSVNFSFHCTNSSLVALITTYFGLMRQEAHETSQTWKSIQLLATQRLSQTVCAVNHHKEMKRPKWQSAQKVFFCFMLKLTQMISVWCVNMWTFSTEHIVNNPGKRYGATSFRDNSLPFVNAFESQTLELSPFEYNEKD